MSADPSKQREFKKRAQQNSKQRDPLSNAVKERAYERTEGCCVVCGTGTWIDPHHILPVGSASRSWPELEDEWRNIIPLCRGCHDNHERHNRKVKFSELPQTFFELCIGHDDRMLYVERYYDHED